MSFAIACAALADGTLVKDPGVRDGAAAAGGPLAGLTQDEWTFFNAGSTTFQEAEGIGNGLGPRLNLDRCSGCHSQPGIGGSSPGVNPQPTIGTAWGRFGIRAKSGHKPKRPLSEKAYLSGRWKPFPIQLKTLVFLSTSGRTISGHPDELSKTGVWPGDWTKLPQ